MTRFRCPAHECTEPLRRGTLMCRQHWYMVPSSLRRDVNRAWRTVDAFCKNRQGRSLEQCNADIKALREAQAAAIEAANAQIRKDAPVCE